MKNEPMQLLGGLSPEQFLSEYWQKKPLLVRQALPGFKGPLKPEDLAGLALEEGSEARLVEDKRAKGWRLRHGPFTETTFKRLPATHWTLLVQGVNRWVPKVASLLDGFRFVPNWRLDDIMISYATPGGSVGPHVDNYDVFLLQGLGERRWQIGAEPMPHSAEVLLEGCPLRVLRTFEPAHEWVLGPGDMLYLPPRIAHHGVAQSACMTYSIGFRAPSHQEILASFFNHLVAGVDSQARYSDPDLGFSEEPGEISAAAVDKIIALLASLPQGREDVTQWFGRFVTEPRRDEDVLAPTKPLSTSAFAARFARKGRLRRSEQSCFAFSREPLRLYIDGQELGLTADLEFIAPLLSGQTSYVTSDFGPDLERALPLLTALFNRGVLYF